MKTIKRTLILALMASIISLVGCKKDKETPQPEPEKVYVCQDTRYTGANCDQQKTPKKVYITKIAITKFPQYKVAPNITWDGSSDYGDTRPDVAISFYRGVSLGRFILATVWDANYNQRYEFTSGLSTAFPYEIDEPSSSYFFRVEDLDIGSTDDLIGEVHFTPYTSTNGFPSVGYFSNGDIDFEVSFSYEF